MIPGNYANYEYADKLEAYGTRLSEASSSQQIDFGLVGPYYPNDPRVENRELSNSDNFQSVDGGIIIPGVDMVDSAIGKVIQS